MKTRVAVVGATGYAGAELVRILSGHPDVELRLLTSRQHAGVPIDRIYPAFHRRIHLVCETYDPEKIRREADVVFTALPHQLPMGIVPELLREGLKVIDLSADFRFKSRACYEAFYQPHTAPELLQESVYGLSECFRDAIRSARLIGNPGCYPTSILLPLLPLLRAGLISPKGIIADSKSGVSGAGRSPAVGNLYSEVAESFKAYKVGNHRHNPEIDEVLSLNTGHDIHVTFIPHLLPMSRGMLSTIYAEALPDVDEKTLRDCLKAAYAESAFIRILDAKQQPDTRSVRGTNYCDIGCHLDATHRRLVVTSAIDNLVKGAAGQAVQNMNLMMGFDETAGLDAMPYPL
ncbi:MAG: N-acetyl-gamma-glutamyl-phosphate reductase [Thermodesulfobacteriota bacterium]